MNRSPSKEEVGLGGNVFSKHVKRKTLEAAEAAKKKEIVWKRIMDEQSGQDYYENEATKESQWEKPKGFKG